ncbi:MAG: DUF2950 family protein [Planctomycetes bacterium]|nr:DUF2950 family protein [Planctomycetota bacterium]
MTGPATRSPKAAGLGFGIAAAVAAAWLMWKLPGLGREALVKADEAAAIDALRQIHAAELEWRRNDGDGNAVPDFWTGDVSGLFRAARPDGEPCAMIDPEIAGADKAPLAPGTGPRPRLTALLPSKSRQGYWFRALRNADGKPLATDGPDDDTNAWENVRKFAFVATPSEPWVSGKRVFLVGEDGTVWAKEGAGDPQEWPAGGPEAGGWRKAE